MKSIETVGILGLGKMGCPIAVHLVAKGFRVVGYDPLGEARNKAVALGAPQPAARRYGEGDDQGLEDPHGARHAGDSGAPLARHAELTPSGKLGYFGRTESEETWVHTAI